MRGPLLLEQERVSLSTVFDWSSRKKRYEQVHIPRSFARALAGFFAARRSPSAQALPVPNPVGSKTRAVWDYQGFISTTTAALMLPANTQQPSSQILMNIKKAGALSFRLKKEEGRRRKWVDVYNSPRHCCRRPPCRLCLEARKHPTSAHNVQKQPTVNTIKRSKS